MKKASSLVHRVSRVVPVVRVEPVAWVAVLPVDPLDLQFRAIKTCIRDISAERDRLHTHQAQVRPKRNQFRS
jgi:hypothetical protein